MIGWVPSTSTKKRAATTGAPGQQRKRGRVSIEAVHDDDDDDIVEIKD